MFLLVCDYAMGREYSLLCQGSNMNLLEINSRKTSEKICRKMTENLRWNLP